MVQEISDRFWQAEARTEETKQFIRDIKRVTRRKFTPEEKVRIVLKGFRRDMRFRKPQVGISSICVEIETTHLCHSRNRTC